MFYKKDMEENEIKIGTKGRLKTKSGKKVKGEIVYKTPLGYIMWGYDGKKYHVKKQKEH